MNLKEQVQSQVSYAQTHKGKAIGSVVGLIAGVTYGLAGKKDNWMVSGLALVGVVGGAILGGMFDKQPAVIVPVPADDSADKTAIDDTAGEEGVMNANGRRRYSNVGGSQWSTPDLCLCNDGTSISPVPQSPTACNSACGGSGVANYSYGGRKVARRK